MGRAAPGGCGTARNNTHRAHARSSDRAIHARIAMTDDAARGGDTTRMRIPTPEHIKGTLQYQMGFADGKDAGYQQAEAQTVAAIVAALRKRYVGDEFEGMIDYIEGGDWKAGKP